MISIRQAARSVPRAVSRLTSSSIRTPTLRQPSLLQSWKSTSTRYAAAFSTSSTRREKAAEGDEELVAKLEAEISLENEMKESDGVPTSVKDYLENSPFEITDTPGEEDITLTRQFGDESIRVTFSIADLNNLDPESDYEQDRAMADEEDALAEEGKSEDQLEDGEINDQEPFPIRVNVFIEKPGKGALAVETFAQDGSIIIENVYYYADASHAYGKTPEKLHERQDLYVGPPFSNLDEELQGLMERYLEERGINQALAIFVPDYIDMKEQKEYLRWLGSVKSFVEA